MSGACGLRLSAIRSAFPGTERWIYLDTSAHALMPSSARAGVARYIDDCINDGGTRATMRDTLDRVRSKFARLIGAEPLEIAVVKNVSEGINAIVTALNWRQGDNAVLCSEIEHPNIVYALYNMRTRNGIEVRSVGPTHDLAVSVEAIAKAIDARTRLVIASTVAYTTGARTDLDELARLCRERGVLLLVDAAQSVGALELDMRKTPLDAMAVGASKYLCGSPGFGFLYVRRELAERMQPGSLARYGVDLGDMHAGEMGGADYKLMPGARRFEAGSYNYAGGNVVDTSIDLLQGITIPVIEQHVLALARQLTDGLLQLDLPMTSGSVARHFSHVVVAGSSDGDPSAKSLVRDIHDHLCANDVKLSIRRGRLRFSFHVYNTIEEVETVLSLIRGHMASPHSHRNGGMPMDLEKRKTG